MNVGRSASPALARVRSWKPDLAVVVGSGMGALAATAAIDDELSYAELGWPCTAVTGHDNRLRLARAPLPKGRELKLALACGRPHRYEGWSQAELELPVRALAGCGVRRLLLTNACGGLRAPSPGVAVCNRVVDLQRTPMGAVPESLRVCHRGQAAMVADAAAAILAAHGNALAVTEGVYVAVPGPQFETPAEAAWLSRYGHVVGMSAAPEIQAAQAAGLTCALLALVVNRAGTAISHDEVLDAAHRLTLGLGKSLVPAISARWPELG